MALLKGYWFDFFVAGVVPRDTFFATSANTALSVSLLT